MMHDVTIFSLPNCILGRIDYRSDLIVWMRFHRNELFVVCFHHGSIRMEPACSRFHPDGASLFMKPHCSTSFRYYKDRPRSFYERFYHDLVEHSRRPTGPRTFLELFMLHSRFRLYACTAWPLWLCRSIITTNYTRNTPVLYCHCSYYNRVASEVVLSHEPQGWI